MGSRLRYGATPEKHPRCFGAAFVAISARVKAKMWSADRHQLLGAGLPC